MNIQKNAKKFILILVLLILFSFCYPKKVNAGLVEDITAAPAKIFWLIERGVLTTLNDMFTIEEYHSSTIETIEEDSSITTSLKIYLTPETIIKGKFVLFDANIFKEITADQEYYDYEENSDVVTGKKALRETISGWYYALRNFAIIALLSVLVYVGIRMIISTVAQDKAKYKVMFKDWLVALCLVILMHYIMIGILNMSSMITEALGGGENSDLITSITGIIDGVLSNDEDEAYTYTTSENTYTLSDAYANILLLFGVIIYTFIFAVKYLKREFTIIFLIILGPVSCITYPIDKISDGKAQAFNRWFSEFLYQVIIQPFHLLLYIVLIGSAAKLANANILYAIVCFAVMGPAEKFIKEMFGFKDKLGSPLGAMATGAAASHLFNKLRTGVSNAAGGKNGGTGQGGEDNNSTPQQLPPRQVDTNELVGGNGGNEGNTPVTSTHSSSNSSLSEGGGADSVQPQLTSGADQTTGEIAGEAADTAVGVSAAEAVDEEIGSRDNNGRESLSEQMDDAQGEKVATDNITNAVEKGIEDGNAENEDEENENEATVHQTDNSEDNDKTKEEGAITEKEKKNGKIARARSVHNQRMSKKWGSTSRGRRWVNRGKKFTKGALKGVAKGTLIGGAAAIATSAALLTGHGKEALGIAGGVAGMAVNKGRKTIKGVAKSAKGAAKDYRQGFRSNEKREKLALRDFKADGEQQDKAVLSYRKNHDGEDPSYQDLDQEMEDRFELSRYGLSDDQIDAAIGNYQDLRKSRIDKLEENGDLNDETWLEADKKSLEETVFAAKLADDYSKKDFRSEKTMKEAVDSLTDKFIGYGVDPNKAQESARTYLKEAAEIKGTDIKLPAENETVDVDVPAATRIPTWAGSLGIDQANAEKNTVQRLTNLNIRMHEHELDDGQIRLLAENIDRNGSTSEIITNFENKINTSVKYLNNENARNEVEKYLSSRGESVTKDNIDSEMRERLVLTETFNINSTKDLNAMRDIEKSRINTKTQKQAAREMALKTRGATKGKKGELKKNLIAELTDGGNVSPEKAAQDAENIMTLAEMYNTYDTTTEKK